MTDLPEFRLTPVGEFASAIEEGAEALATGPDGGTAIPADGNVLTWGPPGAGKTSLTVDQAAKLAQGEPWVGLLHPARPLRIGLIENEGPRQEFRAKLARKLTHSDIDLGDQIVVLEEPWGRFTFADPDHHAKLADGINEHRTDLLIVGPLIAVGAIGSGTPAEVHEFETYLTDLRARLDHPLAVELIHHANKAGDVSGAWDRIADTEVHVTAHGHGHIHLHWKKARWCSALHQTTTQLIWTDGDSYQVVETEAADLTDDQIAEKIIDYVGAHPGTGWNPIEKNISGIGNDDLRRVRNELLQTRLLVNVVHEDGEDVLLDAVRPRQTARLYLAEAPEVSTLRRASGAAPAHTAPAVSADGQLRLRPAPSPVRGAGGAGAASGAAPTQTSTP
jgi:hypothetical protein